MLLRLLSNAERVATNISGVFIIVMMILTTVDVILRDFFNSPIKGNYELQEMMLVGIAYLGMSYVQSQRQHISMDVLPEYLSRANKLVLQLLGDVIFLLVAVFITWQMGLQAWNAWVNNDYTWGLIRFPFWPAKLIIALGTGLICLRLIADIIKNPLLRRNQPGLFGKSGQYLRLIVTAFLFALIIALIVLSKNLDLTPAAVGGISLLLFVVLLTIGAPVGSSMVLIGVWGMWVLVGVNGAKALAGTIPYTATANYEMTVLPLFIAMGSFAALAGFAQAGFDLAKRWLEGVPGGMAQATVLGASAFAAASGSSAASTAVLSKIAIPEMISHGIKKEMAIGVVAAAASLAIMIPPSNMFVLYGMLTGTSIGKLLISGIIPGLIGAAIIMLMIYLRCKLDPSQAGSLVTTRSTWKERLTAIPRAWGIVFIAVVVMGGLYIGIFTPTEAGAIGAFVSFIAMLIIKRPKLSEISGVLLEAGGIAGTIFFILVGGLTFSNMISISRLPNALSEWVVGLNFPPVVIIIFIMLMYFILGTFLDAISTMIITLPIIFPLILQLGYSPIWFGVLMVQNAEIAEVSPPFGMCLFLLKRMVPDTSMMQIFRGVTWFIIPLVLTMVVYIAFPQVALWLPNTMAK